MKPAILVLCGLALVSAGCGRYAAGTGATPHAPPSAREGPPANVPVVTIPQLGTLMYRCVRGGAAVVAMFAGRESAASERVTVEGPHGEHLLDTALILPGRGAVATAPGAYSRLTWRVIQPTEPRTVVTTIELALHEGPDGDGLIDCAARSWSARTELVAHAGKWTEPADWP